MQSCSLFSWTLILALYLEAHLNHHKGKDDTLFLHKKEFPYWMVEQMMILLKREVTNRDCHVCAGLGVYGKQARGIAIIINTIKSVVKFPLTI